jgi:phage-related protein
MNSPTTVDAASSLFLPAQWVSDAAHVVWNGVGSVVQTIAAKVNEVVQYITPYLRSFSQFVTSKVGIASLLGATAILFGGLALGSENKVAKVAYGILAGLSAIVAAGFLMAAFVTRIPLV